MHASHKSIKCIVFPATQVHVLQEQAKRPALCSTLATADPAAECTEKKQEWYGVDRTPFQEATNNSMKG